MGDYITLRGVPINNDYIGIGIDGEFTNAAVKEYLKVIGKLEKDGVINAEQARMFRALLTQGCADRETQMPILLHLREVLVAYMETPEFQAKLQSPNGDGNLLVMTTVTLAAEITYKAKATGTRRNRPEGQPTQTENPGVLPISQETAELAMQVYNGTDYTGKVGKGLLSELNKKGQKMTPEEEASFNTKCTLTEISYTEEDITIAGTDVPPEAPEPTFEVSRNKKTYGDYTVREPLFPPKLDRLELDPRYY